MVRITMEISNGPVRFSASVQAQSIERALEIVELLRTPVGTAR